jgi:hypothetical protein
MTGSKIENLINTFANGEALTAKQIAARFRISNPTATVHAIRSKGYPIYLDKYFNAKGKEVRKYELGSPTREVIAAGIAALGAQAAGLVAE